jgi:hypothetical protein
MVHPIGGRARSLKGRGDCRYELSLERTHASKWHESAWSFLTLWSFQSNLKNVLNARDRWS